MLFLAKDGVLAHTESPMISVSEGVKSADLVFFQVGSVFEVSKSRQNPSMQGKIYFDIKYLFLDAECGIIGKVRSEPYTESLFK